MLHVVCSEDHLRFVKVDSKGTWELLRIDGSEATPLYFHVTPSALITGSFARERFEAGDQAVQAFFWSRIADATQVVERFGVFVRLVNLLDEVVLQAREAYGPRKSTSGRDLIPSRITFSPGISEDAKSVFRGYLEEKGFQVGEDAEYWSCLAAGMVGTGSLPDGATALLLDVAFGDVQMAIVTCKGAPALRHTATLGGLGSDKRVGLLAELLVEKAASALSMPVLWNDPDSRRREVAHVRPQAQRLLDQFEFGELRARVELTIHAQAKVVVREEELRIRDSAWAARLEQQLEQAIGARTPDWAEVLHPVLWTDSLQRFLARKVSQERLRGPLTNIIDLVLRGALGSESAAELARKEQERAEQERLEKERQKAERAAKAQEARERDAKAQAEKERLDRERAERQREAKAQAEKERAEAEREAKARAEKARAEQERVEREKADQAQETAARAERERTVKEQEATRKATKRKRPVPPPPPPPPHDAQLRFTETVPSALVTPPPTAPPLAPLVSTNVAEAASLPSAVTDRPKGKLNLLPRKRTPRWPATVAIVAFVLWMIGIASQNSAPTSPTDTTNSKVPASSDSVPDPIVPTNFSLAERDYYSQAGQLSVGAQHEYGIELPANHEYVFAASCDQACNDLDLILEGPTGATLVADQRPSRTAELHYHNSNPSPEFVGLTVRMVGCGKPNCHFKVHRYSRPLAEIDTTSLDDSLKVSRARAWIGELISSSQFLDAYAFVDSVFGLSQETKDGERERIIVACETGNRGRRQVMLPPFPCPQSSAAAQPFVYDDSARTVLGRATQLSGTGEGFEIISELRGLAQSEQVSAGLRERLRLAAQDLSKQCRGAQLLDSSIICP